MVDPVDAGDDPHMVVLERALAQEEQTAADSRFRGQLPVGGRPPVLARGHHPAEGEVPVAGPHIFPVGSAMGDKGAAVGPPHDDPYRSVAEVPGAHLGPGGGAGHPSVLIHHIHQLAAHLPAMIPLPVLRGPKRLRG